MFPFAEGRGLRGNGEAYEGAGLGLSGEKFFGRISEVVNEEVDYFV